MIDMINIWDKSCEIDDTTENGKKKKQHATFRYYFGPEITLILQNS